MMFKAIISSTNSSISGSYSSSSRAVVFCIEAGGGGDT